MPKKPGSLIGATLLIAGTCIGAGMLAMPVSMSHLGFPPSLGLFLLVWAVMAITGLLLFEVILWAKPDANIISMTMMTVGPTAVAFSWFAYLYLFYSLIIAYVGASGNLLSEALEGYIPEWSAPIIFLALFGPCLYLGAKVVGQVNKVLVALLLLSYFFFVVFGLPKIQLEYLAVNHWKGLLLPLPIIIGAFGFQGTVPSLAHYLQRDVKKTRIAIILGSFIPLLVYTVWQALIMGIVPPDALAEKLPKGKLVISLFKQLLDMPVVYLMGQIFTFCAITTSFLGVGLGLFDFLADGLQVKKDSKGKIFLSAIMFIPPLAIYFYDTDIFLKALQYGAGLGCTLLLILLPVLMVWHGRYLKKLESPYKVFGGKPLLVALIFFVLVEFSVEIFLIFR